ncbi:uncharacterized protein LOC131950997 [Physella acuta]|uniref:uncharacterized protein LOC131950997 n=1 Tax=Physella acuta TaxID=109671 RepID=UPI0027DB214C|nr:uncharacterized protein LOC131950997 [Physella acuta]
MQYGYNQSINKDKHTCESVAATNLTVCVILWVLTILAFIVGAIIFTRYKLKHRKESDKGKTVEDGQNSQGNQHDTIPSPSGDRRSEDTTRQRKKSSKPTQEDEREMAPLINNSAAKNQKEDKSLLDPLF